MVKWNTGGRRATPVNLYLLPVRRKQDELADALVTNAAFGITLIL
jgi:hypothetical protein